MHNTRGSVFSLCRRSRDDPTYPRYPRLPVLACRGHEVWRLEVLAQNPLQPAAAAAYRPAGSALPASVARTLDELIAGEPLDAGAEAAARAGGWKH